jgi:N-methylhydantoinase B
MQTRVDPFLAAVIHGALENIAIEMGHKLMRMSYSSIIRESEDFGAALTDAIGRQLCECTMSTPLQSGPIPGYIAGILRELTKRGDTVNPGDVFMHNDPYGGASHGPDVGFAVPIFHKGALAGFFRHHSAPLGYWCADAGQLWDRGRRGCLCRGSSVQGDPRL